MREKEPTTRVLFVRHGKTDFPTDRIYCDDDEDPALNPEGIAQANFAANFLRAQTVDAIYASPSSRTRMTAEAIASVAKVPITEVKELRERRFGIWDGLFFDEIAKTYPEDYLAWRRDMVHYTPRGGETISQLKERVVAAVNSIVSKHTSGLVVVVSHVGSIRVALADAMKIPLEHYRQIRIDYGAVSRVDYGRAQNNLVFSNISALFSS